MGCPCGDRDAGRRDACGTPCSGKQRTAHGSVLSRQWRQHRQLRLSRRLAVCSADMGCWRCPIAAIRARRVRRPRPVFSRTDLPPSTGFQLEIARRRSSSWAARWARASRSTRPRSATPRRSCWSPPMSRSWRWRATSIPTFLLAALMKDSFRSDLQDRPGLGTEALSARRSRQLDPFDLRQGTVRRGAGAQDVQRPARSWPQRHLDSGPGRGGDRLRRIRAAAPAPPD